MEFTSDCESILTEDFASKFTEFVNEDHSKDSGFPIERTEKCSKILSENNFSKPFHKSNSNIEKSKSLYINPLPNKTIHYQSNDLDSSATENFDDHFQSLVNNSFKFGVNSLSSRSVPPESCNTSINVDMGNISNVQPMRRDIMSKFLEKYSLDENEINNEFNCQDRKNYPNIPNDGKETLKKIQFVGYKDTRDSQRNTKENIVRHELANEIRTKSLRIQNEIHEERRRKLDSIQEKPMTHEQTPREKLDIKVKELDHLTDRMRQARLERERITVELDQLRNKLKVRPNDLRKDTKWTNENRNSSEFKPIGANNQIQMSQNHLSQLNFQLNQKKSQLQELESVIRLRLKEIEELEHIGLSKKEIQQVIEERNDLYEILRQSEENGNDRYELEKKLTEARDDLTMESKRSREKIINLEEELDSCFKKITELYGERDKLSRDLLTTKEHMQRQQDDMNDLYQERNELKCLVEKYKDEIESERSTAREIIDQEKKRLESHLATEEAQSKIKQTELKNQVSSLQVENQSLVDRNSSLKSKISHVEEECQKLKSTIDYRENEYRENLQKLNEEKNQIVEKLKREFYTNKENEIQSLKTEFDSEQMRTINNLRDCYKQQVCDLQLRIETKSQEMQDLRVDIRKLKQEHSDKEDNLKAHFENEISRIKEENRKSLDLMESKRASEIEEIKTRYEILNTNIKKEIGEERLMSERLRSAIDKANKDLVHESEMVKKYKNEKSIAINKVKEIAKNKLQEEYKNLKQFYEKELEEQLQIVEKTMQEKNNQLISKCREVRLLQSEHEEKNFALLTTLNDFIEVLKHQCCEIANETKFILPQWKSIKINETDEITHVFQSAMRNLQICFQESSQYYHEVIDKMKIEKDQSLKVSEEKNSIDIQLIREQILKDHAEELNSMNVYHQHEINTIKLKHQEEIDGMRMNVKIWKCKTAERLAQKLQKEFRKEIESRKSGKPDLKMSSSLSVSSFKTDTPLSNQNPIGLIEDLRGNIRQLREENLSLRKVILGKSSTAIVETDEQNSFFQTNFPFPNGNNSPVTVASRPQSACHTNYRNIHNPKDVGVQRSNSFKNYS